MASKPKLIPLSLNGISGNLTITENGDYNVKHLASVTVNVPTSGGGSGSEPVGDAETVQVIKWSAFQTLVENESAIVDQIYSIEL